jgi:hypothetical protein
MVAALAKGGPDNFYNVAVHQVPRDLVELRKCLANVSENNLLEHGLVGWLFCAVVVVMLSPGPSLSL